MQANTLAAAPQTRQVSTGGYGRVTRAGACRTTCAHLVTAAKYGPYDNRRGPSIMPKPLKDTNPGGIPLIASRARRKKRSGNMQKQKLWEDTKDGYVAWVRPRLLRNESLNYVPGINYQVEAYGNRLVNVWVSKAHVSTKRCRYFCHGHALATFENEGYTVFSAADMTAVLADEWSLLGHYPDVSRSQINNGRPKIAVFFDAQGDPIHSARVLPNQQDEYLQLTSKNGAKSIANMTIEAVQAEYEGSTASIYTIACDHISDDYLTKTFRWQTF